MAAWRFLLGPTGWQYRSYCSIASGTNTELQPYGKRSSPSALDGVGIRTARGQQISSTQGPDRQSQLNIKEE
eukprot:4410332-Alexandrium_andersonii.AAC.1